MNSNVPQPTQTTAVQQPSGWMLRHVRVDVVTALLQPLTLRSWRMDETRRVVVQRGSVFETAEVEAFSPFELRLRGGWTEDGFGSTTKVLIAQSELEARVVARGAGTVTLRPAAMQAWPAWAQRALALLLPVPSKP